VGCLCWALSDKLCHDGASWQANICNSASVCNGLQAGQTIKYDCGGRSQFCGAETTVFV